VVVEVIESGFVVTAIEEEGFSSEDGEVSVRGVNEFEFIGFHLLELEGVS
jgi:hypothetical protein